MRVIAGTVLSLHRWPVKSMGGEAADALLVDGRGVAGDRTHAVLREHKGALKPLTAREAPGLLAWSARYGAGPVEPAAPPLAAVTGPDGTARAWDDPALPPALEAHLGRQVELRRDLDGIQDLPRSVLVTTQASLDALGEELDRPLELLRFRPNVHLDLDAPAWAETAWEGGELAFAGGVRMALLHPCERCVIPTRDPATQEKWPQLLRHLAAHHGQGFGINARVVVPGRIEAGEAVTLSPPS